ncbi:MAG: hypothetical protein Q9173_006865 [Seirophora scorigena]
MAELQLVILFLNQLQAVDLSKIDVCDSVCAICDDCLSGPEADLTWHQLDDDEVLAEEGVDGYRGEKRGSEYVPVSKEESEALERQWAAVISSDTAGSMSPGAAIDVLSYLGTEGNMMEEIYGLECLNSLATRERNGQGIGEAAKEFSRMERMWIWIQETASLTTIKENAAEYRHLVSRWTRDQRQQLASVGEEMDSTDGEIAYSFGASLQAEQSSALVAPKFAKRAPYIIREKAALRQQHPHLTVAELNLITFAAGGRGQLLGSTFGLPATNATFDYVVVGGGTAGLTIATRLASNPAVSVAVIEAGGFYEIDNGNRSIVPGYSSFYAGADPKNYQPLIDGGLLLIGAYIMHEGRPWGQDLPGVGQDMWDHVLFGISRRLNVVTASASLNSPAAAARLAEQFRTDGSGPLSAFGAGFYGWEALPQPYRSALSNDSVRELDSFPEDWPELEWLPVSGFLGYQSNRQLEDPRNGYNYATMNPGIIAPLSRGNISINSSEMTDHPIINPNFLHSTTDKGLPVQGFKRARETWDVLQDAGLNVGPEEYFPGSNVTSDEDILDFIQRSLMTIYHAAGTCKMGKEDDAIAVVDNRARVYGTQSLRVVDVSSFPFLPQGHPQSVIYALAEKIAADILGTITTPEEGHDMSGYLQDQGSSVVRKGKSAGSGGDEESVVVGLSRLKAMLTAVVTAMVIPLAVEMLL